MMHRGLTIGAAMFISAAICLQPRVVVADTEGDVAAIRSLLSDINAALTRAEQPTGVQPLLYDEWVHLWRYLGADNPEAINPTTSAGERWFSRQSGLPRLLWEQYQLFGNDEGYYLGDECSTWRVWDYEWENPDYELTSFREFMSLTLGQNFDARPGWEIHVAGYEAFTNVWEHAFTGESTDWTVGPGLSTAQFWNGWEAEAWRRQLRYMTNILDAMRVNVSNSTAWTDTNTRDETNIWDDVLVSSTNQVGQGIGPEDPFTMPTNAVTWFGPSDGDTANVSALLPSLDWELEGQELEARLFGFDELDDNLTGTLSIDFSAPPWPTVRSVLQFAIAVTTCCVLVGIVRSEVNYWTTLGGSAT